MMQQFIDYLGQHAEFTDQDKDTIKRLLELKAYDKGDVLLRKGDVSKAFYFNLEGLVRMYYTSDGEEKTTFFYEENQFVSSYESFVKQIPADHYLQCLEPTKLVVISHESAMGLLAYSPKFELLARVIMEEELMTYQRIVASFVAKSPEERYLSFLHDHPQLLQRIPQYHIATYLGVNAESLSRIKKRITGKANLN